MKQMWAPWRLEYIEQAKQKKCFFCTAAKDKKHDAKNLVILRGKLGFSLLNRYPYNNGHFMVAPRRHVAALEDLNQKEIAELFDILKETKKRTDKTLKPHAYNIGINIGRSAGAGIVDHIHIHAVPRWHGDVNFMPVTADTKIIPQSLASVLSSLKKLS